VPLRRREAESSWIGQTKTDLREFKTTVRNLHEQPIRISVIEPSSPKGTILEHATYRPGRVSFELKSLVNAIELSCQDRQQHPAIEATLVSSD
jgi:hypothetical protein